MHKRVISPPEEVFKSHALHDGKVEQQKPSAVHYFEETAKIRMHGSAEHPQYRLYLPHKVEEMMGFEKDSQLKFSLEGDRIIVEKTKKSMEISRVRREGGILTISIRPDLIKRMESEEGEWYLPDTIRIWARNKMRSFAATISPESIKRNNFKEGSQIEQILRRRKIILKSIPEEEELCLSKIIKSSHSCWVFFPKEISDK